MPITDVTSNWYFDGHEEVIVVPKREDVESCRDPLDFKIKLDQIDTPEQRLLILIKSIFHPYDINPTHEATAVRDLALVGAMAGFFYGSFINASKVRDQFIRQHNASIFHGDYKGSRMYYDTMIVKVSTRGFKYGFRTSLLMGCAGLIGYGSIVYRDRIFWPDWIVGFSTLGALSRLWIGPRGVVFGAIGGSIVGLIGLGVAHLTEIGSNMSMTQMRYLNHNQWLEKRKKHLRNLQAYGQSEQLKKFSKIERGFGAWDE